jgi:hypothetical protein
MTTAAQPRRWISYGKAAGILKTMITDGSHDPAVLDKASNLVGGLSALNYAGQAQALWMYVRNCILYLEDPRNDDHFQSPAVTMQRQAGDCDDQVILLGSLLRAIGFQVRLVFVFRNPPQDYTSDFPDHVYLDVNMEHGADGPIWVTAETIPTPDDHGGFYVARFGTSFPHGFREYLEVDS